MCRQLCVYIYTYIHNYIYIYCIYIYIWYIIIAIIIITIFIIFFYHYYYCYLCIYIYIYDNIYNQSHLCHIYILRRLLGFDLVTVILAVKGFFYLVPLGMMCPTDMGMSYPLLNLYITMEDHHCFWGKLTVNDVFFFFNSYVSHYQRVLTYMKILKTLSRIIKLHIVFSRSHFGSRD